MFSSLKVTHIDGGGRRCFDPESKRRLIEAGEKSGASVAGLALTAGVKVSQLRRWIMPQRRRAMRIDSGEPPSTDTAQFVPAVEVADRDAVPVNSRLSASATQMQLIRTLAAWRPDLFDYRNLTSACRIALKLLGRRYLELHDEIADLDVMIAKLADELAPDLVSRKSIGYESASQLLLTAGDTATGFSQRPASPLFVA